MTKTYFTGKPCKRGHITTRYASNKRCTACSKIRSAQDRVLFPEQKAASAKRCRAKIREYHRRYMQVNPATPEQIRQRHERYWAKHPEARREGNAKYRHGKRAARCTCCSAKEFRIVYACAAIFSSEVDHVIPLHKGGLHCCKNLQILTPAEHREKTAAENRARMRLVA